MDEIFGEENFIAQIAYQNHNESDSKSLPPIADFILWYARSKENTKFREKLIDKDYNAQASSAFALFEHDMIIRRKPTNLHR